MPDQSPDRPTTYCLIDGFAEIFRSFYAIRRTLYSPVTGEPTQAVLVFAQSLLKLLAATKPDYVLVALDPMGKTFRDELYREYTPGADADETPLPIPACGEGASERDDPATAGKIAEEVVPSAGYKGTRRETPDSLTQQIPRILELLQLFQIPVIECPGMEADDVIATLTERILGAADGRAVQVNIVSPDKDLEQLVVDGNRRVTLYDIASGAETDVAAVMAKRGVTPEQIVDFLALTGDIVDNIPGVAGIGPRTAAKLLQKFGSLDGIREHLPEVEERWRERLQASLETQLPISRRLITLERHADVRFDLEEARAKAPLADDLHAFFDTMGFTRLRRQFAVD